MPTLPTRPWCLSCFLPNQASGLLWAIYGLRLTPSTWHRPWLERRMLIVRYNCPSTRLEGVTTRPILHPFIPALCKVLKRFWGARRFMSPQLFQSLIGDIEKSFILLDLSWSLRSCILVCSLQHAHYSPQQASNSRPIFQYLDQGLLLNHACELTFLPVMGYDIQSRLNALQVCTFVPIQPSWYFLKSRPSFRESNSVARLRTRVLYLTSWAVDGIISAAVAHQRILYFNCYFCLQLSFGQEQYHSSLSALVCAPRKERFERKWRYSET